MSPANQQLKALCAALILIVFGSSCNSNSIPGVQDFTATIQTENNEPHFYTAFVATELNWNAGVIVPIPGLTDATVGITPSLTTGGQAQGTVFQFDIDLSTLGFADYSLGGLPDGRDLPDITGGQLPRWQFSVDSEDIYVYLSSSVFGLFIPLNLEADGVTIPATVSVEIDDSKGNLVGEAYAIPTAGGGTSSGLLFLIPFVANTPPAQTSQALN